jgi:hypothetical protein
MSMLNIYVASALLLMPLLASAQSPVYKCEAEGKISYASVPCPGGAALPPAGSSATGSPGRGNPAGSLARQQALADQLARERHQRDAQDERERQQAAARRLHCDKLRLRKQWRDEDLAKATASARAKMQRHARRSAEELALSCP